LFRRRHPRYVLCYCLIFSVHPIFFVFYTSFVFGFSALLIWGVPILYANRPTTSKRLRNLLRNTGTQHYITFSFFNPSHIVTRIGSRKTCMRFSGLCSAYKHLIRLLVDNNIPMVLHVNPDFGGEIMIYVTRRVQVNILDAIIEQKPRFENIKCKGEGGWQPVGRRAQGQFVVHMYLCRCSGPTCFSIAVLKDPAPRPLELVNTNQKYPIYFGLKNKTMKKYTGKNLQRVFATYVL